MKSKNTRENNANGKIKITKMLIVSIIIFIMLLLESTLFLNIQTKAATNSIISDDYYVVDENEKVISRIEPETDITTFKNKLIKRNSTITTENLKIYKEKECKNEVTEGLIGTSMFLKIEANSSDNIYELSVVGDIDGDGKSSQISLAKIIRYIVGTSNEQLEGIKYKSADLTGDGTVDQRDITKIIRYIVFGELDLGKINQIPYATENGAIIFGDTVWNDKKDMAEVEISTQIKMRNSNNKETNQTYIVEYQVNGTNGTWTRGYKRESVTVTGLKAGDILYARLTDGTNVGSFIYKKIEAPEPEIKTTNLNVQTKLKTTTEIQVEAEPEDTDVLKDDAVYTFYIKEQGADDSEYIQAQSTTSKICNFTNLKAGTKYIIKIEAKDSIGNNATKVLTEETKSLPGGDQAGSLQYSELTWNNGEAKVAITTNTEYQIEYQVVPEGGSLSTDKSSWKQGTIPQKDETTGDIIEKSKANLASLHHNDLIYARLTDGKNYGKYATLKVIDAIKPVLDLNLTAEQEKITAVALAKDLESGIPENVTYKFYMKETGSPDTTYEEKQNTTEKTLTIPNLTVGKNYTIKLEVQDKAGNIGIVEKSILIPDDIAPVVDFTVTEKTTSTAKVIATATDVGGLPNPTIYVFYIKETGADDSTYKKVQESDNNTCEFTGLEQGKDYTVKVTVDDEAHNTGIKERSILTETIPDGTEAGAINFEKLTWVQTTGVGKAQVTISTNTKYQIEYQIVKEGSTLDATNIAAWQKGTAPNGNTKSTAIVTEIDNNSTIYARLTDGQNSSNYKTLKVADLNNPTLNASLTSTTSEIKLTVTAVDNETGLGQNPEYKFYIKANSNSGKTKDIGTDYSTTPTYTGTNATYTFTGLKAGQAYTVKVEVTDLAGNKAEQEQTVTTKTLPDKTSQGALVFSAITWTKNNGKGTANVTISTSEADYYIEYQVVVNGQTLNATSWTKGQNKGEAVTLNNLNNKDTVYARLTDGTNFGNYATLLVADTIKPKNFTIEVSNVKINGFTVKGQTEDNQTGIKDYTIVVEKKGVVVSEITKDSQKQEQQSNNINRVSYNNNSTINTSRSSNSSIKKYRINWKNKRCTIKKFKSRCKRKDRTSNNRGANRENR